MTQPPEDDPNRPPEPGPVQQPYPQQPGAGWPPQPTRQEVQAGPLIGGLVIGFILGLVLSVVMVFVGALLQDNDGGDDAILFLPQLVPILLAVSLLAVRRTRMAGAGLVMGIAIGAIVVPSACVVLFGAGSF